MAIERLGIFLSGRFGKCCASDPRAFLLPTMVTTSTIGRSVPRREGAAKVTGAARYTDDLVVPGAWYGKTIRSTVPRGRIRSITLDPTFDWSRVVVVTAPPEVREARRGGVADREDRLVPEEEKVRRADHHYVNDRSLEELDAFVAGVMEELRPS